MPGFYNCLWWAVLGGFAGWLLFWIVDLTFRRDGEMASTRDRADIDSLSQQLSEASEQRDALRQQLADSRSDSQRVSGLLEGLRESFANQEQQISSLEAALAAAREPQRPAATGALAAGLGGAALSQLASSARHTDGEPTTDPMHTAGASAPEVAEPVVEPVSFEMFSDAFTDSDEIDEFEELDELSNQFPSLDELSGAATPSPNDATPSGPNGHESKRGPLGRSSVFARLTGTESPAADSHDAPGEEPSRLFGRLGGNPGPGRSSNQG